MPITINGSGTVTGISAGGLPDDSIVTADIAAGAVTTAKIADANITAAKLDGAQSGSAPIYAARAWVNFNGTGTVAIRASGNVSSITDNGVGDYTVNFTTAMPDANYAIAGAGQLDTTTNDSNFILCNIARTASNPATGSLRLTTLANGPNKTDATVVAVAIFR